jgi:hypothetical protein
MAKKIVDKKCEHNHYKHHHGGNAVYGLGFIGAVIYYISSASTFWMGVLGVLKALVWPVFLVLQLFKSLGM